MKATVHNRSKLGAKLNGLSQGASQRSGTRIHNNHAREKAMDVTRVDSDYAIGRLIHSFQKLSHQLDIAVRKGRQAKVITLVTLMNDTRAKIEQRQALVDKQGKTLNLTSDPKSVRAPNTRSAAARNARPFHGKPDTVGKVIDKGIDTKHNPEVRTLKQGTMPERLPTFQGNYTAKARQFQEYRERLAAQRKKLTE